MTVLERWFEEVWNKGNEAAIDQLLATDVVIHNNLSGDGEKIYDVAGFKKIFKPVRSALSEVQVKVEYVVTDGDMSAARCVVAAIHRGDGFDRVSQSKPIHFTGMAMVRVRDSKIVESWNHFDFETMFRQME